LGEIVVDNAEFPLVDMLMRYANIRVKVWSCPKSRHQSLEGFCHSKF